MNVTEAVMNAYAMIELDERDEAAFTVTFKLARLIDTTDDARTIGDLSIKLLTYLTALGLKPASRVAITKGTGKNDAPEQRAVAALHDITERRKRLHAAPDMDGTPS